MGLQMQFNFSRVSQNKFLSQVTIQTSQTTLDIGPI